MTDPNSNFSQVTAITRRHFLPMLADNIFLGNPLLRRAKSKGWLDEIDGGTEIIMPLEYAIATASGSYTGAETLDVADNDVFTAASLNWKQYYAAVTLSRLDELKNSGKAQVVNFAKSKMKNAEKTLRRKLSATTGMYSSGSVSSEIVGLPAWVNASSTVGGISQTDNSWWQAGSEDTTTTTLTLSALQTLVGSATEDTEKPTVLMTTQAIYNSYYSLLTPQQRYIDSDSASAGFSSLMHNGVPMLVDSNCPTGDLYALNEDYLHLFVHKDENFRMTDFDEPINQNVKVAKIFWMGEFGCNNNRYQAAFKGLTA